MNGELDRAGKVNQRLRRSGVQSRIGKGNLAVSLATALLVIALIVLPEPMTTVLGVTLACLLIIWVLMSI